MNRDPTPPLDDAELLAWLDGRLSRGARARVDARLADDAAARDLLFDLARGPSPGFAAAVRTAAAAETPDPLAYALDGPYGGIKAAMDDPREADGDAPPVYAADGVVDLILRPGAPLSETPQAAVFVCRGDGPLTAPDVSMRKAPGGAMRLRVPAARLFAEAGRYAICVAIGADVDARFVGRTLLEARRDEPDIRWLAADVFFNPSD